MGKTGIQVQAEKEIRRLFHELPREMQSKLLQDLAYEISPKSLKQGELVLVLYENCPRWGICLGGGKELKLWLVGSPMRSFTRVPFSSVIRNTGEIFAVEGDKVKVIKKREINEIIKRITNQKGSFHRGSRVVLKFENELFFGDISRKLKDGRWEVSFDDGDTARCKESDLILVKSK